MFQGGLNMTKCEICEEREATIVLHVCDVCHNEKVLDDEPVTHSEKDEAFGIVDEHPDEDVAHPEDEDEEDDNNNP
jgi:hypothetical protein